MLPGADLPLTLSVVASAIDVRITNPPDDGQLTSGLIGVVGALLGAIVGGFASYRANTALEKKRRVQRAAIRRRAKVYTPLWQALSAFHMELAEGRQLTEEIETRPSSDEWTSRHIPRFSEWTEMREDGRSVSAAPAVAGELDGIERAIERFNTERRASLAALDPLVRPALVEVVGEQRADVGRLVNRVLVQLLGRTDADRGFGDDDAAVRAALSAAGDNIGWSRECAKLETAEKGLLQAVQAGIAALDEAMKKIARKYEQETPKD